MAASNGRGGRRTGAGAPKGNRNAFRTGCFVADETERRAWRRLQRILPSDELAALRRGRRLDTPLVAPETASGSASDNFTSAPALRLVSRGEPSMSSSSATDQSNNLLALSARMTAHGFHGAVPFLRRHFPAAGAMIDVLDRLDELAVDAAQDYDRIRRKSSWLYGVFHESIAERKDDVQICRFCSWGQTVRRDEEQDTGS